MEPSSAKYLSIMDHSQKSMKISTINDLAYEGSPAQHVDSNCEAGK
jgi:hypothetical protein